MKFHDPALRYVRPTFWPWAPGQQLGLMSDDLEWSMPIYEQQVLHAWWLLAGTPGPWDPTPFVVSLGATTLTDQIPRHLLQMLRGMRLAYHTQGVWVRRSPHQEPADVPPLS